MIIGSAGNGLISRSPTWFNPSQDFTKLFYIRKSRTPLVSVTAWLLGADLIYNPPYIFFGTSVASTDSFFIEYDTGSGLVDSTSIFVANNTNVYVGIRYTRATHLLELLFNGVVQTSFSANFDALTVQPIEAMLNEGSSDDNTCSIAYERFYQRALSNAEIIAEMTSITSVSTTSLLSSCLLQASIDLTDHKQTYLAVFGATGTVITNTTDPLLSIVAGPPTNIDPNTATLITYNSAVFQNTLTAGAATDVWHKAVAQTGDKVWGAEAFGDLVTYKPTIFVYDGLANALANSFFVTNNPLQPVQFQVTPGNTYYFKSARNGAVTPAILQLSILRGLTLPVPIGSLAIPDVTQGFPLALLDSNTGYPINWVNDFPVGESVGILINGKTLMEDATNDGVKLYDSQLNLLATPAAGTDFQIAGSNDTGFIDAKDLTNDFKLIDEFGNVGATTYNIGAGGIKAVALSQDNLIAYIIRNVGSANQPLKKFVLATSTLSDLAAGIPNFIFARSVVCFTDGTVFAGYNRIGIASKALRYNADGTTANTYNLAADDQIEKLALSEDSINFWIWSQPSNQYSRFYKIKISDGTAARTINNVQKYNDGQYKPGVANTNSPVRFGHSFSCPLWITRVALFSSVNQRSGIYTLTGTGADFTNTNPRLTHDVVYIDASVGTTQNMSIPTPFGETFLAGNE